MENWSTVSREDWTSAKSAACIALIREHQRLQEHASTTRLLGLHWIRFPVAETVSAAFNYLSTIHFYRKSDFPKDVRYSRIYLTSLDFPV